jgi:hypothetical protein
VRGDRKCAERERLLAQRGRYVVVVALEPVTRDAEAGRELMQLVVGRVAREVREAQVGTVGAAPDGSVDQDGQERSR